MIRIRPAFILPIAALIACLTAAAVRTETRGAQESENRPCGISASQPPPAQVGYLNDANWELQWTVADEGLELYLVNYRTIRVLSLASMPVIRVTYPAINEEVIDRITHEHLARRLPECPGALVCQMKYSYQYGGITYTMIELSIYACIGEYEIKQAWQLWDDGHLSGYVASRGLQYPADHEHHPYWRLDFDIDGPQDDLIEWAERIVGPSIPSATGLNAYRLWRHPTEFYRALPEGQRTWRVSNRGWGRGAAWIYGPFGPDSNAYSNRDIAVVRFNEIEASVPWPWAGELPDAVVNNEDIDGEDLMVWLVGHIYHPLSLGPSPWHVSGFTTWFNHTYYPPIQLTPVGLDSTGLGTNTLPLPEVISVFINPALGSQ